MQNFIQPGEHLEITNATGATITSGTPVIKGKIVGIALGDIADTEKGQIRTKGVFELTKKAALAISEGDALYWDSNPGEITKTAADGTFIGFAVAAHGGSDTTVKVLLVQDAGQASIPVAADVNFAAGSNLVGVDGTGSNAAPLAGTETRLDALDTAVAAIISSLQAAGLMAS
jgi:predicted RecA/RadA family phage recombinase